MSAALALDARGVPVAILEAEPAERERPGTRADYVHGSTLELLDVVESVADPDARDALFAGNARSLL